MYSNKSPKETGDSLPPCQTHLQKSVCVDFHLEKWPDCFLGEDKPGNFTSQRWNLVSEWFGEVHHHIFMEKTGWGLTRGSCCADLHDAAENFAAPTPQPTLPRSSAAWSHMPISCQIQQELPRFLPEKHYLLGMYFHNISPSWCAQPLLKVCFPTHFHLLYTCLVFLLYSSSILQHCKIFRQDGMQFQYQSYNQHSKLKAPTVPNPK